MPRAADIGNVMNDVESNLQRIIDLQEEIIQIHCRQISELENYISKLEGDAALSQMTKITGDKLRELAERIEALGRPPKSGERLQ
jgi:hypothetical protein